MLPAALKIDTSQYIVQSYENRIREEEQGMYAQRSASFGGFRLGIDSHGELETPNAVVYCTVGTYDPILVWPYPDQYGNTVVRH